MSSYSWTNIVPNIISNVSCFYPRTHCSTSYPQYFLEPHAGNFIVFDTSDMIYQYEMRREPQYINENISVVYERRCQNSRLNGHTQQHPSYRDVHKSIRSSIFTSFVTVPWEGRNDKVVTA